MSYPEEDALSSDLYLDHLLASRGRSGVSGDDPAAVSTPVGEDAGRDAVTDAPALDPSVRAAAEVLAQNMVRFHPSFRFEEWLAERLREAAEAMAVRGAAGAEPIVLPLRARPADAVLGGTPGEAPRRRPGLPGTELVWSAEGMNRGLLLGGAIASGVSLAGAAAFLAWRRRTRLEERPA